MEEKITLDKETFKTLASGTRVEILKSLDRRRKMLAELSRQFGMSPSTIKEHMDNLVSADLVTQIDDGHKWKYYELTPKGREIVRPTGSRITIVLALSLFAAVFTAWDLARTFFQSTGEFAARSAGTLGSSEALTNTAKTTSDAAVQATAPAMLPMVQSLPVYHILGLVVFTAIFGVTFGYWMARKKIAPAYL